MSSGLNSSEALALMQQVHDELQKIASHFNDIWQRCADEARKNA